MGDPVPPFPRETVMRMAHHAVMHMTWERGRPARIAAPRARRRPPPCPSPTGGGHPAPPPGGGRLGGGLHAANDMHLSRPCGSAAHEQDENQVVPERTAPSHTLPPGGRTGKPGFPIPLRTGCAPKPSRGPGDGETRFPHPPAHGLRHQTLPRAGVWGNPVSPYPSPRA